MYWMHAISNVLLMQPVIKTALKEISTYKRFLYTDTNSFEFQFSVSIGIILVGAFIKVPK